MKRYLLDTCILSEYIKKRPNEKVIAWLDDLHEANLFISVLTLGELQKGVIKQKRINLHRYNKLSLWINAVEQRFNDRVINVDSHIITIWASLCGTSESQGIKLPIIDSLIAATAQHHNLEIVTRNTTDFSFYSSVFNPWDLIK